MGPPNNFSFIVHKCQSPQNNIQSKIDNNIASSSGVDISHNILKVIVTEMLNANPSYV